MFISSHHVDPRELVKTVVLENEEKEEELQTTLEDLDRNFSVLMVAVRSSLDHKLQHQQLVLVDFIRWIEHQMKWIGELGNVIELNELFKKLHPYFDFIDCELIVDMSEKFLNNECFGKDKRSLVSELKEHIAKANTLRCSLTVKQLKNQLKSIYFPHIGNLSKMSQICITLHMYSNWNDANINALYLLIQHILPHKSKQSILKYITIDTGSVRIKYFVHESKADYLIAYAEGKLQFMRLIGIFGLTINGKLVLEEDENMNFSFELALHIAAISGHNEVVQFLLKLGGDVDHCDELGITALMLASKGGHEQVVQTLVSARADVNIQDNEGWTALMLASQYGRHQVVELLIKENANINHQQKNGVTALMVATGHHQVVELLLKEHADINTQNEHGWTALMLASHFGQIQIVKLLLQWDADVSILNKDNYNALMVASQEGHLEVLECLLQSQADPHILAYDGSTAFSLAAFSGNRDLVNMLLDKFKPTTDEIEKAVVLSCYGGHPTLITFLSNKLPHLTNDQRELLDSCVKGDLGAVIMKILDSPDTPLVLGLTPLMVASSCGHLDMVDALIQAGADVNRQESHWGFTPLFFAVRGGKSLTIVETLLEGNANPNVIADKKTPLDDANYKNQASISELLTKYGGQTRKSRGNK